MYLRGYCQLNSENRIKEYRDNRKIDILIYGAKFFFSAFSDCDVQNEGNLDFVYERTDRFWRQLLLGSEYDLQTII